MNSYNLSINVSFYDCVFAAFADVIVAPMFAVGGDMIDLVMKTAVEQKLIKEKGPCARVWDTCLQENIAQWRELALKGEWAPSYYAVMSLETCCMYVATEQASFKLV